MALEQLLVPRRQIDDADTVILRAQGQHASLGSEGQPAPARHVAGHFGPQIPDPDRAFSDPCGHELSVCGEGNPKLAEVIQGPQLSSPLPRGSARAVDQSSLTALHLDDAQDDRALILLAHRREEAPVRREGQVLVVEPAGVAPGERPRRARGQIQEVKIPGAGGKPASIGRKPDRVGEPVEAGDHAALAASQVPEPDSLVPAG